MDAYFLDWANLLLRWVHVITAIAWIGSSFYFVFLDNNLIKPTSPDLLEKGVDSSNLARARAFDYYDKVGFLGMSAYADPYRAKELMEMMVAANYPGGALRKIRAQTAILSFGSTEADKRAGCAEAKRMLKEVKLDADSTRLAQDVVGSGVCTGYDAQPGAK